MNYEKRLLIVLLIKQNEHIKTMKTINSIIRQNCSNWKLIVFDVSESGKKLYNKIKNNSKIEYVRLTNENYIEKINRRLIDEKIEYICFINQYDILSKNAVYEINSNINNKENIDLIYSDEDIILNIFKVRIKPSFKPSYGNETLYGHDYLSRLCVIRKSIFEEVGCINKKYKEEYIYDLCLRICHKKEVKILHIEKILYHRNIINHKIERNINEVLNCINDSLERNNILGRARKNEKVPNSYFIEYETIENPLVSIIIPNKDAKELLSTCLESIRCLSYKNIEIIIVENNSELEQTFEYYKDISKKDNKIKVVYAKNTDNKFNYSKLVNIGVKEAKGKYILLLNNDVEILTKDAIQKTIAYFQNRDLGAVGVKLLFEDKTIQHIGVVIGMGGIAGHPCRGQKTKQAYNNISEIARNVSAVTAAFMVVEKEKYEQVNGFDEKLEVAFNDVDFCLKLKDKNLKIIYTPIVEAIHYESKTRGEDNSGQKYERYRNEANYFKGKWFKILEEKDENYNSNLDLRSTNIRVNIRRRKNDGQ